MFNAEAFLNQTVDGAMATRLTPLPPNDYVAIIAKLAPKTAQPDGTVPCDVVFEIDDANLKATLKRSRLTSKMTAWLEFKEDGALDNGENKNVSLGKLRAAVGQNDPTQPWAPSMLIGKAVRIKVTHRTDKKTGDIFDEVSQVTKL